MEIWISLCKCAFKGRVCTIVKILPRDFGNCISDLIPNGIYLLSGETFEQLGANGTSGLAAQGEEELFGFA